jgi:nicotinamidase-related amidase
MNSKSGESTMTSHSTIAKKPTASARSVGNADEKLVDLGSGPGYKWRVNAGHVDMAMPEPSPVPLTIQAESQLVTLDLRRTAIIVIDMQNDFCEKGGWVDHLGVDYSPDRMPIEPLQNLLPGLRRANVPVIWVNWGNRPDLANMPPNQLHLYKPSGVGIGLGEPLPDNGHKVLEKDSWAAAVVDGLDQEPGDIRVDKYRMSGFWDTQLDAILRNYGIKTLLFAGVNTDQCVLTSLQDANFLGYGCVLVEDCCATTSPDYCTQATLFNVKKGYGFVTNSDHILDALRTA